MSIELRNLLHPRVLRSCEQLYTEGHYKHVALEAMTQVERALKEKSGVKQKFGVNLVTSLFGEGTGIKLRVAFGEEMQEQAEALFRGAFSYYRNYAAHDGTQIDEIVCLRVMILASELLDLIGASTVSFTDVGGVGGLVKQGIFPDGDSIHELLSRLDGYTLPDEVVDGYDDDLFSWGFTRRQVEALIDVGLIEYVTDDLIVPRELLAQADTLPKTVAWFEVTDLGNRVVFDDNGTCK